MRNCFSCKIKNECNFSQGTMKLIEDYKNSDDGLGIVMEILIDSIRQYVHCSYYENI